MSILPGVWFVVIGALFTGYIVLDGYDLGIGMVSHLAETEDERRMLINSIAPYWDGNEVWLVTAGGALFAAFPDAYATAFSAFYEPFVLFLTALIARACAIELHGKLNASAWRGFWSRAFRASSFVAPLLLGVAFGNILWGIPLDSRGEFRGTFLGLLGPFPLMVGLTLCVLMWCHGAIYAAIKTDGGIAARAARCARASFWAVALCIFFLLIVTWTAAPWLIAPFRARSAAVLFPIGAVASLLLLEGALRRERFTAAFVYSSLVMTSLLFTGGVAMYPNMVPSNPTPANSLTIANSSSSVATLQLMLVLVVFGLPLVLIYTYYVHRVFKGKVRLDETSY